MDPKHSFHFGLPPNLAAHGHQIDHMFTLMHVFMLVLFVGWFAFLIYTLYRFRARKGHEATYAPKHSKFSTYLEIGVAIFEVGVLVLFAIPAWKYAKATLPTGSEVLHIRVVGEQFAWNIQYPGDDGVFGRTKTELISSENPLGIDNEDPAAKDDVVTLNNLNVPVNKKVVIYVSSKDVVHSFTIPKLRVKQDAVPGNIYPVWFEAEQTGSDEIVCSQLCGLGHYRMRGQVEIQTEDAFKSWLKDQKESMQESE